MTIELIGTLKVIFAKEEVGDKLEKQNIVVTIDENTPYPQDIIVQAINKKRIETLTASNVKIGDKVIVKCNLKGRENKSKAGFYFNQLDLWSISKAK